MSVSKEVADAAKALLAAKLSLNLAELNMASALRTLIEAEKAYIAINRPVDAVSGMQTEPGPIVVPWDTDECFYLIRPNDSYYGLDSRHGDAERFRYTIVDVVP